MVPIWSMPALPNRMAAEKTGREVLEQASNLCEMANDIHMMAFKVPEGEADAAKLLVKVKALKERRKSPGRIVVVSS